jgi:hypothetical protein
MTNNPFIERAADLVAPHRYGTGTDYRFVFDNGYAASVVRFTLPGLAGETPLDGSYGAGAGLWELAVLADDRSGDWTLCYDTPVTDDVLGYLSERQVAETLRQVAELPDRRSR